MTWQEDIEITRQVRPLLGAETTALRRGQSLRFENTRYGRVEAIRVAAGFLLAAEHPPAGQMQMDRADRHLSAYLARWDLKPWKLVSGGTLTDLLAALREAGPADAAGGPKWCAYAMAVAGEPPPLIGPARRRLCDELRALLEAAEPGAPLPLLRGPAGVGRHTVAAHVARAMDLEPVELPLRRLVINRVLSTPTELMLEVLIAGQACLGERHLVLLSDAELLAALPGSSRQLLAEAALLPNVLLLAADDAAARMPADVAALDCPGLADAGEAAELIAAHFGGNVVAADAALAIAARAALAPGAGILPGRVLYIVRLASAMRGAGGEKCGPLCPDDVIAAVRTARQAWQATGHVEQDVQDT
jgi:hypothetical protein